MKFIITRPLADGLKAAARLKSLHHQAILSPVIEIRFLDNVAIPTNGYQALALSSANAARALARCPERSWLRGVTAFAVGGQSAEAARASGLTAIKVAGGDVRDLARMMISELNPVRGLILYLSGTDVSGDLKGLLEAQGFVVQRVVLYEAVPAVQMAREARDSLGRGEVGGIFLYSPRSARIWKSLVESEGLDGEVRPVHHFCLSMNVAEALGGHYLTRVASQPTEDALFDLLDPTH